MVEFKSLSDAIIFGDIKQSQKITKKLISKGVDAEAILNEGLFPGMDVVGKRFKENEIYIPDVLVAAEAMRIAMDILKPFLVKSGASTKGTIVLGTVLGDIHNLGKNLVGMMLEGGGFRVVDVGVDIPPIKFLQEVKRNNAQILALSTLLTTAVPNMRDTIKTIRDDKETKVIRIMVGGVPLNQEFADSLGADGFASNAGGAMELAAELYKNKI